MQDEIYCSSDMHFIENMMRFLGETVTVFTTSGGESGSGFTGVLTYVSPDYIKIVVAIGSPPECGLGNECDFEFGCDEFEGRRGRHGRRGFQGRRRFPFFGLGSVVDIPVSRIASFVHNSL